MSSFQCHARPLIYRSWSIVNNLLSVCCIRTGSWFDGTTRTIKTDEKLVPDFAPRYVMEHRERYRELLVHPDVVKLLRK